MVLAAVFSVAVMFLLIHCLLLLQILCVGVVRSLILYAHCVLSNFAMISLERRVCYFTSIVFMITCESYCLVSLSRGGMVGLQFVFVPFPCHTHLL